MASGGNALLDSVTGTLLGAHTPAGSSPPLVTITGIDLKSATSTNLYTVPNGKTLYVTEIVLRITAATAFVAGATVSVGKTAAFTEWLTATAMGALSATNQFRMLSKSAAGLIFQSFAAGDVLALNVTVGATATTLTAACDIFGYLL